MSEKPLDAIGDWLEQQSAEDALRSAARQYAMEFRLAQHVIAQHLRAAAALARRHGHENLLARLPPEVASAVSALRDMLIGAWSQLSSDPVPLFEPEPEPEPEPPGE